MRKKENKTKCYDRFFFIHRKSKNEMRKKNNIEKNEHLFFEHFIKR